MPHPPSDPPTWLPATTRGRALLGAALVLGLGLRLVGLGWGLPNEWHVASYHPDEFRVAGPVLEMLREGKLSAGSHAYGSFFHYLTLGAARVGSWVRPVGADDVLFLARLISALLGTATVYAVHLLGAWAFGARAGLWAAFLMAALPGHVLHAHFASVDVPATCLLAGSLALAARYGRDARRRWLVLGAVAAGCAAATKYPAGIALLAVLAIALLVPPARPGRRWARALAAASVALATFVAVSPYVVLEPADFWREMTEELIEHQRAGHGSLFEGTGPGPWYQLTVNLPYLLGPLLVPISLVGVVAMAVRRRPIELALLAQFLPFALVVATSEVRFLRYTFPCIPVLVVGAASLVERARVRRTASEVALGLALAWMLVLDARMLVALTGNDPRDAATAWFVEHVPEGATVGIVRVPGSEGPTLMRVPPTDRVLSPSAAGRRFSAQIDEPSARHRFVLCKNWNLRTFRETRPEWVVLSEFQWRERQRLGLQRVLAFLDDLERDYELAAELDPFPGSARWLYLQPFAPHDWLYPFPTVRIHRRR